MPPAQVLADADGGETKEEGSVIVGGKVATLETLVEVLAGLALLALLAALGLTVGDGELRLIVLLHVGGVLS